MAGVTRNRALDLLRKRGRSDTPIENDVLERLMHEAASLRADQADLDALLQCMERLEETPRQAVIRAYCEGRTSEELEARYGVAANTGKNWRGGEGKGGGEGENGRVGVAISGRGRRKKKKE